MTLRYINFDYFEFPGCRIPKEPRLGMNVAKNSNTNNSVINNKNSGETKMAKVKRRKAYSEN